MKKIFLAGDVLGTEKRNNPGRRQVFEVGEITDVPGAGALIRENEAGRRERAGNFAQINEDGGQQ